VFAILNLRYSPAGLRNIYEFDRGTFSGRWPAGRFRVIFRGATHRNVRLASLRDALFCRFQPGKSDMRSKE